MILHCICLFLVTKGKKYGININEKNSLYLSLFILLLFLLVLFGGILLLLYTIELNANSLPFWIIPLLMFIGAIVLCCIGFDFLFVWYYKYKDEIKKFYKKLKKNDSFDQDIIIEDNV